MCPSQSPKPGLLGTLRPSKPEARPQVESNCCSQISFAFRASFSLPTYHSQGRFLRLISFVVSQTLSLDDESSSFQCVSRGRPACNAFEVSAAAKPQPLKSFLPRPSTINDQAQRRPQRPFLLAHKAANAVLGLLSSSLL